MAKIFITGVAGFLGSHLADRFLQQGHQVVGTDNLIGGYMDNVPKEVEFYTYDCNFLNSMKKIMKDVDIVYHCAATAYEGLSVFSPYYVNKNIYQITASILSSAVHNKVKRIVFTSSMARYGENQVPFTEDMEPRPQDPYGIGKFASEMLIKNICQTHGMEYVIAVPHNIIGPRQKYDDPYRNVASIFINRMLQGKQPMIYGDGEQKRCFSFVHDCLQCLEKMAFQDNVVGEVINIGPDEEVITINQLAKTIAELLNFDLNPIYMPGRPQEVKLATCSADKARKMLGYQTNYTLKQGLQEMIDQIKERGAKPFRYHIDLEIINEKTPKTWKDKLF
ncbi:MAG: NAD-dependent epimerase/dehydratase family protein [Nanoarchaeota archaeon]|nr:NAD-dependent epimerase/dehydratase family protein [Nanoarchaeota archaeon]MBU1622597.1 NAD-dependent epimerase/dehydratase family protein [Nanoarchaeota archaeon]MBU1974697.1 NAD-dependent epimerase/dehydratase family protein [Nanoarchaeota archaeon]